MKTFKQLLQEKLSLKVAKEFSRDWNREYYNDWFGKNTYRLYFDENSGQQFEDSAPHEKIERVLQKNGYEIENWEAGLAKKKGKDKNLFKIGKLLNRFDPELKKEYDLLKDSSSKLLDDTDDKKKLVVISRHPYDIAGMSSDREWDSCMKIDPDSGEYSGSMSYEINKYIKNNALIAYLIYADDKNIQKPLGRYIIFPYAFSNKQNQKEFFLIRSEKAYGKVTPNTKKVIDKFLNFHQSEKREYLLNNFIPLKALFYSDANPSETFLHEINSAESLINALEKIAKDPINYKFKTFGIPIQGDSKVSIEYMIEYTKNVPWRDNLIKYFIENKNVTSVNIMLYFYGSSKHAELKIYDFTGHLKKNYTSYFDKLNIAGYCDGGTIEGGKSYRTKYNVFCDDLSCRKNTCLSHVSIAGNIFSGKEFSNGFWLNGQFNGQDDESLFINSIWDGGIFVRGTFDKSIWNGGIWNKSAIWKSGYDKHGKYHGPGDSPDKWGKK